jgi:hypothetical protein
VEVDLYIGGDPVAFFEAAKQDALAAKEWRSEDNQIDGWVDWPSGFPDQNDYELVSHCGAHKNLGTVYWVQEGSKTKTKTLVQIGTPAPQATKLSDYADGVWQVVYGMDL